MATSTTTAGQRGGFNKRGRPGPHAVYSPTSRVSKEQHSPHPMSSSMSPSNLPGVYSNPDMAYALVAVVGSVVDVQMQSGDVYRGVLKAFSSQLSVALALASDKSKEQTRDNMEDLMQLEFADVVSVTALSDANPSATNIFKTDTEISRTNGSGYVKELQPFAFDDGGAALALTDQSSGWSAEAMFETNRSKFNVESSYNEEMTEYTTKLDRSDTKDFRLREQRAEKLAHEIEGSVNKHGISDIGTEEELFSSVVRQEVATPPPGISKPQHVPPHTSSHLPSRQPLGSTTRMVTEGHSYSAVAENALELRLSGKGSDSASANSSHSHLGTNSSLSQTSSQELHAVQGTDMDTMNLKGGWPSPGEFGLSLSGENNYLEKEPHSTTLEEGSQESLGPVDEEQAFDETNQVTPEHGKTQGPPGLTVKANSPKSLEKEENVRKFQLDPNAKTFSLNIGAKEFVPSSFTPPPSSTSPLTQSASSPSVLESSSYNPPPQYAYNPAAKKYPKRHNHNATTGTPQDLLNYVPPTPTGSYLYSPALVRNPAQQMPGQQIIQYSSSVPQFVPSYPPPAGASGAFIPQSQAMGAPQHMVNNGQTFEINPVFAGNQYSMPMASQQQLMQQQQLLAASQQLSTGGIMSTPSVVMVQGGGGVYQPMAQVGPTQILQNRYIQPQPPPN